MKNNKSLKELFVKGKEAKKLEILNRLYVQEKRIKELEKRHTRWVYIRTEGQLAERQRIVTIMEDIERDEIENPFFYLKRRLLKQLKKGNEEFDLMKGRND